MLNEIKFKHDWNTIRMLGEFLYSNPWSALSELIANSFDAKSPDVYICFNFNDHHIYLFDQGHGMDLDDLNHYVEIGYNKRISNRKYQNDTTVMGRKGIGKFASLFISTKFEIYTKVKNQAMTSWLVDSLKPGDPKLESIDAQLSILPSKFKQYDSGTCLILKDVDLRLKKSEMTYEFINNQLSVFFSYISDGQDERTIYFKINDGKYEKVSRKVAFSNMNYLLYSKDMDYKLFGIDDYHQLEEDGLEEEGKKPIVQNHFKKEEEQIEIEGKNINVKISGWIGIHSTIAEDKAFKNDTRFTKGYIPSRISLYVRNKLAYADILPLLKNTQAFSNYIEGDIHCDILDANDLPDIAATNRQSINELDIRFKTLINIVRDNVKELISNRNKHKQKLKESKIEKENAVKKDFIQKLYEHSPNITDYNKIKHEEIPDGLIKSEGVLFFSHSSEDRAFSDFFYFFLREVIGVNEQEIFYTSSASNRYENNSNRDLENKIKEVILKKQSYLNYFSSVNHNNSNYCMFECGAGWITRSKQEYLIIGLDDFDKIPVWLQNGQLIVKLKGGGILNEEIYLIVLEYINNMIEHLNLFRTTENKLKKLGKSDTVKQKIIEYWNKYITGKE